MIYTTFLRGLFRALFGRLPSPPPEGQETGLVLVADGVGGLDLCGTGLVYMTARDREKSAHVVRVVPWGHGFGRWYKDLTNTENLAAQAVAMAAEAEAFLARRPGSPVFLVGKSGGSGVVVGALEKLPEGAVEAAVLLAPALSPGYDLTRALRAVRRELAVFWSPLDVFVLGVGTRVFGTIDRVRSRSAGLVGFRVPEGLDESGRSQYAKLRQIRWNPGMAATGYLGGHVGPDSPAFLRKYVVPLLCGATVEENGGDGPEVSSRARAAPIT
jgi:pimeloyl-ACP methyl ester carboxylesterase